jgi:RHS repeat-associated protein
LNNPQFWTEIRSPSSSTPIIKVYYTDGGSKKVSSIVTPSGTWNYAYSDVGSVRTLTITDPMAHQRVVVSSLTTGLITSDTNENGRTTSFLYDAAGRVARITHPETNYTQLTYDARGNVTERRVVAKAGTGLADIVTMASFPATCTNLVICNRPSTTTDAMSRTTDYSYDPVHGGVLTVTAPAPASGGTRPQMRFTYSPLQAYYKQGAGVVASGQPISLLTGISSCATGASCAGTADESKRTIGYGPQTAGVGNNLLAVSMGASAGDGSVAATTTSTYDMFGNLIAVDGPLAGPADTITYRYDAARQIVGSVMPDADGGGTRKPAAKRFTYDVDGRLTVAETGVVNSAADGDWPGFAPSQAVTTSYDSEGRKLKEILSSGGADKAIEQYSYDVDGRLECAAQRMNPSAFSSLPASACTIGPAGTAPNDFGSDRITRNIYDAADQITKVQTAYGTADVVDEVTTGYTNNGLVAHVIDAENNRTAFSYDGHDRLVKTAYPSPAKGTNAASTTDYEQLAYDANGNVITRRLRDGSSIDYGYDNLNRLVSKNLPGAEPDATYGYDLLDRQTSAVQGGQTLGFSFDALGRNLSQSGPLGTVSYQYDAAGQLARLTYPGSGLYVTYDYDAAGNVLVLKENGASTLATYAYDDLARRTNVTLGNGVTQSFGFDTVSRLSTLSSNLGGTAQDVTTTFTYNPANQIRDQIRSNDGYAWNGHYNVERISAANGLNQLVASTPGSGQVSVPALLYDSKGNLTTSGSNIYGYSSENFLKTAPGGVSLDYDPLGRLYQAAGATTTRFQYDGDKLIAEYDGSNGLLRRYVHGPSVDEPILWYEGTGTTTRRYLTADERGSVIAVTDASGNAIQINAYDEYGIPAASNLGRFQYTGQTWLPELGFYYYKARMYSPTLGRFMQTDPIGYQGGINWYNYVGSDPVNARDSSGLDITVIADIVVTGTRSRPFSGPVCGSFGCNDNWWGKPDEPYKREPKGFAPKKRKPAPAKAHRYVASGYVQCDADEAFELMRDYSAPGAPYSEPGAHDRILTGNNPITQVVNVKNRTIVNITREGHRYFPGTVAIAVVPSGAGAQIAIIGTGTTPRALENTVLGFGLFQSAIQAVRTICSDVHSGPVD